ncbi:MAG TPA: nuclear transport factor 2 family protein [Gemmatimonadaceae bacterium]
MRRPGLLAYACIAIALTAASAGAQKQSATEKAVLSLEEEWTRALVRVDTVAFKRLTVPGFVYTEDNVMMTQPELLKAIVTGDRVEWAGNEGMKLHDYGNVAVVTGILVTKGKKNGKTWTNRYRFTDTWINRNGRWQAIAAQDYLIK